MAGPKRISPNEAHDRVGRGDAMLVAGYESDEKYDAYPLAGAIPLSALRRQEGDLSLDQELIFYCA